MTSENHQHIESQKELLEIEKLLKNGDFGISDADFPSIIKVIRELFPPQVESRESFPYINQPVRSEKAVCNASNFYKYFEKHISKFDITFGEFESVINNPNCITSAKSGPI